MNYFLFKFRKKNLYLPLFVLLSTSVLWGCDAGVLSDSGDSDQLTNLPVQENLVLHLEADRGVAVEENKVTGWIDNSLLGNDLTSVGDPSLIARSSNNQPTIHFDGQVDKLERTFDLKGLPTGSSDRTAFMVVKYNSKGFGGFAYGHPTDNNVFGLVVDTKGDLAIQAWGQDNDRHTKVIGNGSGWLTQSAKLEQGVLTYYKNGVELNKYTHNYNTIPDRIVVGAEIDNSSQVDMEVSAILVFDRALNEVERREIESYLQDKYFLQSTNLENE